RLPALYQEGGQGPGVGIGGQFLTEALRNHADATPLLWGANDAAYSREATFLEKLRRDAIGGGHEVFNQLLSPVFLFLTQVDDFSVTKHRLRLDGLKLEGSMFVASRS